MWIGERNEGELFLFPCGIHWMSKWKHFLAFRHALKLIIDIDKKTDALKKIWSMQLDTCVQYFITFVSCVKFYIIYQISKLTIYPCWKKVQTLNLDVHDITVCIHRTQTKQTFWGLAW